MPEKEGAEEKSTKSVVNKKQKQMMGEEGYDHLRDQGRIRKNKKKKDATTMPPSKEMEKLRKVNKGPSALERVKKKYKGQIMDVKKEELDLTKVAEAFGGYIVEAPVGKDDTILPNKKDLEKDKKITKQNIKNYPKQGELYNKETTPVGTKNPPVSTKKKRGRPIGKTKPTKTSSSFKQGELDLGNTMRDIEGDPQSKKIQKEIEKSTGQKTREFTQRDKNVTRGNELKQTSTKPKVRSARRRTPSKKLADIKRSIDIKNPTVVGKSGGKIPLKLGSKKAVQSALKTGTKTAVKRATAKGAGKLVAKRVPGVGAALAGAETIGRAAKGDYVGAAISGAETIANILPGVQHTIGTGLAGINMARDIRRASRTAGTIKKTIQTAKAARKVKKVGSTAVNVGPRITTSGGKVKSFVKTPKKITKTLPKTEPKPDAAYSPPGRGKIGDIIFGTTKRGRRVRGAGVGLETLTGVGRKTIKGLLGMGKPKVDGSHVGRRTAG